MALNVEFQEKIKEILDDIDPDVLDYDEDEYWMIQSAYEFVEYYAIKNELLNTAIALPLARGLHNGDHRKSSLIKGDLSYRLPYIIHPLVVCKMLIELRIPLSHEEQDILYAAALCHDMIEDIPFLDHGRELTVLYHLNPDVYETVRTVSKRKNFTEEEERAHFQAIAENKLATLIKLSDRGNNVEDLYNMSARKVYEYVDETQKYLFPICQYAKEHYPEIKASLQILEDKMFCLTEAARILVTRYEEKEQELHDRIEALQAENDALRATWKRLWQL